MEALVAELVVRRISGSHNHIYAALLAMEELHVWQHFVPSPYVSIAALKAARPLFHCDVAGGVLSFFPLSLQLSCLQLTCSA